MTTTTGVTGAARPGSVGAAMTPHPVTVLASDSCCNARRLLGGDWTDAVPVVSAQGLFVGVLRRRALDRACRSDSDHHETSSARLATIMDHRAFTVTVDDDLALAQALMDMRQVDRLPVVDGHMHVVGLLDRRGPRLRRGASRLRKDQ
jgi:CBS domain-containing protein